MPSCAFEKCRNHSRKENKTHGITFHAFPQDESWRYKWVRVVRKQRREPAWRPTTHSRVCSLHFQSEDMYTTEKGLKKIANGAVPSFRIVYCSRFPQDPYFKEKWIKIIQDDQRDEEWMATPYSRVCSVHFEETDFHLTPVGRRKIKPNAIPCFRPSTGSYIYFAVEAKPTRATSTDSETSNTELVTEETQKEEKKFLKRKIERVIANKRKLLIMNKKLKRQNKRLIEKCKSLKGIVSHLKETVTELESKLEQEQHNK